MSKKVGEKGESINFNIAEELSKEAWEKFQKERDKIETRDTQSFIKQILKEKFEPRKRIKIPFTKKGKK